MLENNYTFQKLLQQEIHPKPTLEEIVQTLNKKSEWRSKDEVLKLKYYFEDLTFFQSLKKENEADDDIIYQCCKELKYRKYTDGQPVCKYGEEGKEFYVIIQGRVQVFTPKNIEINLTLSELNEYINTNKDMIIFDRSNRHLLEQALAAVPLQPVLALKRRRTLSKAAESVMSHFSQFEKDLAQHYEFQFLTCSTVLKEGHGFGELALMNKKPDKRSASVISQGNTHIAILDKEDFQKVILVSMEKKLDQKVDFMKNFRLSEGISRANLTKLSYFLKDKQFRRRDIVFKEGDIADGIYFIKEGEFEISQRHRTKLEKSTISKGSCSLLKTIDIKVSLIGANQVIGLEDMIKDQITFRMTKVQCVTEKGSVLFLTKDDYFTRYYKQMQKHVIIESQLLKEPFIQSRLNSLKNMATKENLAWLMKKERFYSKEQYDEDTLNEFKSVVNKVQSEELCHLLMKHKLLKKPQLRRERSTSQQLDINDFDPNRYSTKDYYLKMAELYNNLMFSGNPAINDQQYDEESDEEVSPQNNQRKSINTESDNFKISARHHSPSQPNINNNGEQSLIMSQKSFIQLQQKGLSSKTQTQALNSPTQQQYKLSKINSEFALNTNTLDMQQHKHDSTTNALISRNEMTTGQLTLRQEADEQAQSQDIHYNTQADMQKNYKLSSKFEEQQLARTDAFKIEPTKVQAKPRNTFAQQSQLAFNMGSPQSTKVMNKSQTNKYFNKRSSQYNKSSIRSMRPTITLEVIQAHLMKSQESLMQQLHCRMRDRQAQSPGQYNSNLPKLDSVNMQGPLYQTPQTLSSAKKSNIYFNMFINKK